ncbi:arginine--tRNA ligase, partial [candidate division KSB1 bacterium RBG_16_48_16]
YDAYKEFYINDAGRQVRLLGESLAARYVAALGFEREIPQDGYHGDYLRELAANIATREGSAYVKLSEDERAEVMSQIALSHIVEQQQKSLSAYGVFFDNWFRESSLRDKGAEQSILEKLQEKNLTYQQDGALWFKSSEFGDEKDRVLITQEGEPTYFFIDIAYHQTKYERGFTAVHDFWGPDHHGYIDRMKSAMLALGHPKDSFHVSIIQQVNLLRDGKPVKMSKRAGEIIEMDELIEEVGVDAARYFFVDRKMSQPLDFDIELAKKQSDENPVYYLQYAHARICSIFRFAEESGIGEPESFATNVLDSYHELNVIKRLIDYPEVVVKSAQFLEPHRLTAYLTEVATVFHRFYHEHRVVTEDREKTFARLLLAKATRQVLSNGLKLLGITAPEKM